MKQKLLELLQSTEGFLSGQELSDHLNVSRTAVWKVMKSLEEEGYEIEAVRNKGYSLKKEPDILTKESCASRINTKWLGKNLMVYDVTDSTNTRLKLAGEHLMEALLWLMRRRQEKAVLEDIGRHQREVHLRFLCCFVHRFSRKTHPCLH